MKPMTAPHCIGWNRRNWRRTSPDTSGSVSASPWMTLPCCLENAGIGVVSGARLAPGLRGVHYIQADETYAIHYLESQWEGGKVHTVLHETYEIVHEQVWHRLYGSPLDRKVCPEADRFAAAVMMPPDTFEAYTLASGPGRAGLAAGVSLRLPLGDPSPG